MHDLCVWIYYVEIRDEFPPRREYCNKMGPVISRPIGFFGKAATCYENESKYFSVRQSKRAQSLFMARMFTRK